MDVCRFNMAAGIQLKGQKRVIMQISELLNNAIKLNEGLQNGTMIKNVLSQHEDAIMELQKHQLFAGMASNGDDLHPYYTEDLQPSGYFKSIDSAKRYAAWKETLNYPYSANRNTNAPNLYINGRFHSELDVTFDNTGVKIDGATMYAKNIVAKYGLQVFGLTKENWSDIWWEKGAYNELLGNVKKQLFGN